MRRLLITFCTFLLCWLICLVIVIRAKSTVPATSPRVSAEPEPVLEERTATESANHEKETQLARLTGMEARQRKQQLAAAKTYEARRRLQLARLSVWSSVINTNAEVFLALRQEADKSPNGETPCTICDGAGSLAYCVLCENTGQCPGCQGAGKGSQEKQEEVCPTCLGRGKCYLCAGRGKMPCLHCDDGIISHTVPLPPSKLPIRWNPPPTVEATADDPEVAEPENTSPTEAGTLPAGHADPAPPPSQSAMP